MVEAINEPIYVQIYCPVGCSALFKKMSPFVKYEGSSLVCMIIIFIFSQRKILYSNVNSVDSDQTPRVSATDLGHCYLPMLFNINASQMRRKGINGLVLNYFCNSNDKKIHVGI